MKRDYFMNTNRIGYSRWKEDDLPLARLLWGDPKVTEYICASGVFSEEDIRSRLDLEIANGRTYGIQYWPLFDLVSGDLAGACGLRPYKDRTYEAGIHLRPQYWHRGYGEEAMRAVIRYAFRELGAEKLFAGHNPRNTSSERLLLKLGFVYTGDEYYPPTGLYHPSYELVRLENKT